MYAVICQIILIYTSPGFEIEVLQANDRTLSPREKIPINLSTLPGNIRHT